MDGVHDSGKCVYSVTSGVYNSGRYGGVPVADVV